MRKMKRIIATCLTATMMLGGLCACVQDGDENTDTTHTGATDKPATTDVAAPVTTAPAETASAVSLPNARDKNADWSVLMVGNSFSYYNDLNKPDGIFYNIATRAGYRVTVDCVYKGGYNLKKFFDPTDEYGKQVREKLAARRYDIIIIQEQSHTPISKAAEFYDSCRAFKKLADDNGAELWLYATWGYKAGHASLSKYGNDTADMEMKLRASYTAIADELGIKACYAGAAFSKVYAEHPSLEIYYTDKYHPGLNGSYLAGWVLFGSIFGVDPATLTYNGDINASYAGILRAAASSIVLNGAPIADGYTRRRR